MYTSKDERKKKVLKGVLIKSLWKWQVNDWLCVCTVPREESVRRPSKEGHGSGLVLVVKRGKRHRLRVLVLDRRLRRRLGRERSERGALLGSGLLWWLEGWLIRVSGRARGDLM
jgi:hypothetical protein